MEGGPTASQSTPKFRRPPVVEVAMAVQFAPISKLGPAELGWYWKDCCRDRFPHAGYQARVEGQIEVYPAPSAPQPRISVRMQQTPPAPRLQFFSADRTRLLQVQNDQLIFNWLKNHPEVPYPGYSELRPCFEQELASFKTFLDREALGRLDVAQCEIIYVDQIADPDKPDRTFTLPETFKFLKEIDGLPPLHREPETGGFDLHFPVLGPEEQFLGRLHIQASTAVNLATGRSAIMLQLTARGAPPDGEPTTFLDLGHDWIVNGFADITRPDLHAIWGREA